MSKMQVTWLSIVLLVAAAGIGALLWQRQQNDDELSSLRQQLSDAGITTSQSTQDNNVQSTNPLAATAETAKACDPAIVHEPTGLFSRPVRTELTKKLSHPLRDYYAEQSECPASLNVSVEEGLNEYKVHVIFGHDKYSSFLYGDKTTTTQPWWYPECLDQPCEFSQSYEDKYPEVVDAAGA